MEKMSKGDTLWSAVLSLVKLTAEANLNPNLPDEVGKACAPLVKNIPLPIDMFVNAAKVFKNFDVDFQFNGTDQLPEGIRKGFFKKECDMMVKEKIRTDVDRDNLQKFAEGITGSCEVFFVVPEYGQFHAEFNGPKFFDLIKKFHWK